MEIMLDWRELRLVMVATLIAVLVGGLAVAMAVRGTVRLIRAHRARTEATPVRSLPLAAATVSPAAIPATAGPGTRFAGRTTANC